MTRPPSRFHALSRSLPRLGTSALLLGLLAACAVQQQAADVSAPEQAAQYAAKARGNYVPPGPPEDPWGPYIKEAAERFDVPEVWVRAVMRVESGGQEYRNGQLITSAAGAMGLMQVMPQTYEELRERYGLGGDPFDPHDNIIAGVAYMRELYDIYGSPGFLAAYNGGPARLDDYLGNFRALPDETRHYVAMIAPAIEGVYPVRRSPAESYAMNDLPEVIPAGLRYGRPVMLASSRGSAPARHGSSHHPVEVARATPPSRPDHGAQPVQVAMVLPPPAPPSHADVRRHGGFHVIQEAQAAEAPVAHGGSWAIQVGAFASADQAQHAAGAAKASAHAVLAASHATVAGIHQGRAMLWRARLTGLSKEAATDACKKLARAHGGCMVISPESQS